MSSPTSAAFTERQQEFWPEGQSPAGATAIFAFAIRK
jgi:hypothetical protein